MRDPKSNWTQPKHSQDPHRSLQAFADKKVRNQAAVHASPSAKCPYDPVNTHGRTLEVGRPVNGGNLNKTPRPHAATRPGSSPTNYSSFQELALNKRRHMTDIDGRAERNHGYPTGRSPRSPGGNSQNGSIVSASSSQYRAGYGGSDGGNLTPAGMPGKGGTDLLLFEPRAQQTNIPHQSLMEFNLKKQQHMTRVHETDNDPRFIGDRFYPP